VIVALRSTTCFPIMEITDSSFGVRAALCPTIETEEIATKSGDGCE
jgi:hypothetical protein